MTASEPEQSITETVTMKEDGRDKRVTIRKELRNGIQFEWQEKQELNTVKKMTVFLVCAKLTTRASLNLPVVLSTTSAFMRNYPHIYLDHFC